MADWLASALYQLSGCPQRLPISSCTYPWNCPIGVLTAETMYTGGIGGGAIVEYIYCYPLKSRSDWRSRVSTEDI